MPVRAGRSSSAAPSEASTFAADQRILLISRSRWSGSVTGGTSSNSASWTSASLRPISALRSGRSTTCCHIEGPSTRSQTLAGRPKISSIPSSAGAGAPTARTASTYSASARIQLAGVAGFGTLMTAPRP